MKMQNTFMRSYNRRSKVRIDWKIIHETMSDLNSCSDMDDNSKTISHSEMEFGSYSKSDIDDSKN